MDQDQDATAPARASRRAVLGGALGAAAGLAAPAVHAQGPVTLRFLGTAVNQHQGIKDKVREDWA